MASLFERLERTREGIGPRLAGPVGPPLPDSVLANVRQILNARQGCCQIRQDFGLPDLTSIADEASEIVSSIAKAVATQLERFEPRLRHVRVKPSAEGGRIGEMAFTISAVPVDGGRRETLSFDAVVDQDGQIRLA